MKTACSFTDNLASGRILRHGVDDNGMYFAEIKNKRGIVEASITAKTGSDTTHWLKHVQQDAIITCAQQTSYDSCEKAVTSRLQDNE